MKRITRLGFALAAVTFAAAVALAAEEAAAPVKPFNGKDLTGWTIRKDKEKSKWVVGAAKLDPADMQKITVTAGGSDLINPEKGEDIYTDQKFGDCVVKVEVLTPKRSNSGIYLMGEYEVQIGDSFSKTSGFGPGDMGGIYATAAPKDPKYNKVGEWDKFEIHFQAPKFDAAGKKTANAKFVKVLLNGSVIHENVEAPKPTGGELSKEVPTGPLMFQGDHGPVAFRNLEITPVK